MEHFLPKSLHPKEAYRWLNFRLVCSRLNGRRGTIAIPDPFLLPPQVPSGWFVIDFRTLFVKPRERLPAQERELVLNAIRALGLNDPNTCLATRIKYVDGYWRGIEIRPGKFGDLLPFDHICKEAPFVALELQRQELTDRQKLRALRDV